MTVPDFDPFNNDSFKEPLHPSQEEAIEFEVLIGGLVDGRTELLDLLHFYQEGAFETDENAELTFYQQIGRRALQGNLARFTSRAVSPEIMPSSYIEMPWTPNTETTTALSVKEIIVRTPVLEGVEFGVFGESAVTPQDIFIEVEYVNGETYKYFFNDDTPDDELVSYDDGRDLLFSAAQIEDPRSDGRKPSVFSVAASSVKAPRITINALRTMIDESTYNQRPVL